PISLSSASFVLILTLYRTVILSLGAWTSRVKGRPPSAAGGGCLRNHFLRLRRHLRQLAHDLRAQCHLDDAVKAVAFDLPGRTQHETIPWVDITLDLPVQHNAGHVHIPFYGAGFAD